MNKLIALMMEGQAVNDRARNNKQRDRAKIMNEIKFCFITNSNRIVRLGTFIVVHKCDLRLYAKRFPIHWFEA